MAFTSYPFSSSPLATEAQYALTASRWGNDGVHTDDLTSTALKVTANGTSSVSIAAGSAFVNGATVENDGPYSLSVVSNSGGSSARKDLVVLRYDASADSILPVYKTGGTTPPTLTNSPGTGVVEIPLAECTVAAGASVVASNAVVDRRWGSGHPVAYGTAGARRPSVKGMLLVEGPDIHLGDGTNWLYVGTASDPVWSTYTPVWTAGASTVNWGSGSTNRGRYKVIGKTCFFDINLIPSGDPATTTSPIQVTLPVPLKGVVRENFTAHLTSAHGGGSWNGTALTIPTETTTKIARIRFNTSSGWSQDFTTNVPFNMRINDVLTISGVYEIA
ncbi:hypothetical protein [Streptomyces aurantiogriseus]|uniref:Minor tail protein n=1 Tax=Streptomyces aurantiogriseus TaxID=66870 RepID=A0A918FAA9_9ACTN|nr:hypothetical protein [Streptomyces aurantiogriseus]GGR24227.1 hypothetical protein GCM10010251_45380 [Streptomyces aurantiogriseus]